MSNDRGRARTANVLFDLSFYSLEFAVASLAYRGVLRMVPPADPVGGDHFLLAFILFWVGWRFGLNVLIAMRDRRRRKRRLAFWLESQVQSPYLPEP